MQTKEQYLLGKIAEECNEAAQRANKISNFGLFEIEPNHTENNLERFEAELYDLIGTIQTFYEHLDNRSNILEDLRHSAIDRKKIKLEKFYQYSKSLGRVG